MTSFEEGITSGKVEVVYTLDEAQPTHILLQSTTKALRTHTDDQRWTHFSVAHNGD